MSGYDQNKDKLIKLFEMKKDKSSLLCSVFSYDGGNPKLGFSRSFLKNDGSVGYSQLGRVSIDEMKFLKENIDEIINAMTNVNG
jgi:hypothetical protein